MDQPISNRDVALEDLMNLICGKQLGSGQDRQVFKGEDFIFGQTLVVKLSLYNYSWQNAIEWQAWLAVRDTVHKKWFAPCITLSNNGRVLIQERTTPIPENRLPKKIPAYLTDTKRDNFGLYKGRVVCHDYGLHQMLEKGMTTRMVNVDWWGDKS